MTVGEVVGWHHQLDGHEFEQDKSRQEVRRGYSSLCCTAKTNTTL